MALLDIRQLDVAIHGAPILDSIDVSLDAGEILGVAGESGSGKTMMALAVAGLLPAGANTSGDILLDGVHLSDLGEGDYTAIRGRDIGIVFQEPMTALNPLMTIGDQVAEAARLQQGLSRRAAQSLARATLDRVGLPAADFPLDRYPHSLSGGQRQRVAIAIAIALKPKLLIADEPTTALDVSTQAGILALFRSLVRDDGIGLMLVTHDLAVIAETADRVAVMRAGKVVETGDTGAVLGAPESPYTRSLLADTMHTPQRTRRGRTGDEPVLEARNIVREYVTRRGMLGRARPVRAVDEVSLAIYGNENVGLVGESGCGKSTLLRTILGLDAAQSGEIRVFGETFPAPGKTDMRRLRQRLQVVFQDPFGSFDPRWRVRDLVAENFHLLDTPPTRAEATRKVDRMLEQVGLKPSDAFRYPHEFSGGQRQRLAIARALITDPAIIALDEAVSALDVSVRARILDLLAELSDRLGVSYLFVTHDLSVLRSIADRVLVMRAGRIVEQGSAEDVFLNPTHDYTAGLLQAVPDLDQALSQGASPDG
jgi:peptide/nickel transport system ATP-binding protein